MYKFLLASRYLRTRFIAFASIISVTLGVATMIVVNSVMSGFSSEMQDRIHGILADLIIESRSMDGTENPQALIDNVNAIAGADIEAITPAMEIYGMMSFKWLGQTVYRPVTLIGIVPDGKDAVSPLKQYMLSRQSVMEKEVEIRGPLRNVNDPLDWSLTEEATAVRKEWAEWKRLTEELEYSSNTQMSEQKASVDPFFVAEESTTEAPAASDFQDPFASSGGAETSRDLSHPLSGRVFVGAGLVSFPFKDEETGETRMRYMTQPGYDVNFTTISSGRPKPVSFPATVVDIFRSGMSEYDSNLVFCNLEELQQVRGMMAAPDPTQPLAERSWKNGAITMLQIKLKEGADAQAIVHRLQTELPGSINFAIQTWEQKRGPLLAAVAVESAILNVLLFLIIAVAGFGILAIFYMIVVEKTRDIGILKSLGASSGGIMMIFLSYGLSLGIVGSGAGVALGLAFVHYINEIEQMLTMFTGHKVFDETIYYFHEIPTVVHPLMVLGVALGAMIIAILASILPALRASKLHPVHSLRYE